LGKSIWESKQGEERVRVTEPHIHRDDHAHEAPPPQEPGSSWTGYAVIKYGFILLITIVVLYFIARYLIPLFD
jgi:hypothetical protein